MFSKVIFLSSVLTVSGKGGLLYGLNQSGNEAKIKRRDLLVILHGKAPEAGVVFISETTPTILANPYPCQTCPDFLVVSPKSYLLPALVHKVNPDGTGLLLSNPQ